MTNDEIIALLNNVINDKLPLLGGFLESEDGKSGYKLACKQIKEILEEKNSVKKVEHRCTDDNCEFSMWTHAHNLEKMEWENRAKEIDPNDSKRHDLFTPFCYNCARHPESITIFGMQLGKSELEVVKFFYCNDHFDTGKRKLVSFPRGS